MGCTSADWPSADRVVAALILLAALCACASQGDPAGANATPQHVGGARELASMNGVRFMSWNDQVDNFAAPADSVTIEFRAINTAPERRCYRWAVAKTQPGRDRNDGQSPGWVEIGPAPRRGASLEDGVGAWLQWRSLRSGQCACVNHFFTALNVPEGGSCQSYNGIYDLDFSTSNWHWHVDIDRLVALAGVDASGWPQLHKLLGDSVQLPRPDGSWQHLSELPAYQADKTVSPEYRFIRVEAEAGRDRAMYSLGLMYAQGNGVRQDSNEAIKWFRRAAEQGNAGAEYILGAAMNRKTITPDPAEARRWLRRAADQGEAHAQFELGTMYVDGQGGRQDNVAAHMWLSLASAHLPEAEAKSRELAAIRIASIEGQMTASQIADARSLTAQWRPTRWPSRYGDSVPTWVSVPYDTPGSRQEVDSSSITEHGNLRAAWARTTFDSPQKRYHNNFVSSKGFWIFDCGARTAQLPLNDDYGANGEIVWRQMALEPDGSVNIHDAFGTFEPKPGSSPWAILNAVCSYPAEH